MTQPAFESGPPAPLHTVPSSGPDHAKLAGLVPRDTTPEEFIAKLEGRAPTTSDPDTARRRREQADELQAALEAEAVS